MRMAIYIRLAPIWLTMTALALSLSHQALAEDEGSRPIAVVELFTSQGCSSCPPADAFLAELAERDDVVALAYHVDYWDYLGWNDTLADAGNSARQREYNDAFTSRSVYTPQAVINGREHVNGAKKAEITRAMTRLEDQGEGMAVDIAVTYDNDSIIIEAGDSEALSVEAQIVLVYFKARTRVEIEQGKNGGHIYGYRNAVRDFHSAGSWNGNSVRIEIPLSELDKKDADGCAVLVQKLGKDGQPGAIIGAASMTLDAF